MFYFYVFKAHSKNASNYGASKLDTKNTTLFLSLFESFMTFIARHLK